MVGPEGLESARGPLRPADYEADDLHGLVIDMTASAAQSYRYEKSKHIR